MITHIRFFGGLVVLLIGLAIIVRTDGWIPHTVGGLMMGIAYVWSFITGTKA